MSDIAIAEPSRQAIQARTASRPRRVTGALQTACKAIVWDGQKLDEAAATAGLTTRALRLALERPHVIAYLKTQKEVFRESVCGRNIIRLAEIRDAANNMPAVNAIKVLEQLGDDADGHSAAASRALPGLTITIIGDAQIAAIAPKGSVSD